ncbi:hypothetical protein [Chitinophaga sp. CF418]|uniref:hypothetical protein n=1 Tax=Chitinophaga sp. CF418 TaxID=1855287 RepID=UPI000922DB6E|nr:hypothetical protein [Chitinophaga sp. CF418]SHN22406.1 hypothetical protein SAMN05216311_10747 [Chitinophaga sp. CF418]
MSNFKADFSGEKGFIEDSIQSMYDNGVLIPKTINSVKFNKSWHWKYHFHPIGSLTKAITLYKNWKDLNYYETLSLDIEHINPKLKERWANLQNCISITYRPEIIMTIGNRYLEIVRDNLLIQDRDNRLYFKLAGRNKKYTNPSIHQLIIDLQLYQLPVTDIAGSHISIPKHLTFWELLDQEISQHKDVIQKNKNREEWTNAFNALLQQAQDWIKRKIKQLRRLEHHYLILDIRHHIRTIIRSLRITPFDGKDADHSISQTPITNEILLINLFKNIKWQKNKSSLSW